MQHSRRNFLKLSAASLLLAGCGEDEPCIIMLGDSIQFGVHGHPTIEELDGYGKTVRDEMVGWTVEDTGINTGPSELLLHKAVELDTYHNICIMNAGIWDASMQTAPLDYWVNMESAILTMKEKSDRIILCGSTPIAHLQDWINLYNGYLASLAIMHDIEFLPLEIYADESLKAPDGWHYTNEGSRLLGLVVTEII